MEFSIFKKQCIVGLKRGCGDIMKDENFCKENCMCYKCPRLELPIGDYKSDLRGGCFTCKVCKGVIPITDLRKGECCMWRVEYERPSNWNASDEWILQPRKK